MSKTNLSDPSAFLYLDMLADVLMHDTLEMESDFNTKMQFIKEQEQKVLDNGKNLLSVNQFLGSVNRSMLKLEMELNENETNLLEAEKAVTRLEKRCPSADRKTCRVHPLVRATYEDLLGLLLSTEQTASQCNQMRDQIMMYGKEAAEKVAPANVVKKIIDYHNSTLESLEKHIVNLQSQVTKVQKEFDQLSKKLEVQNLLRKGNEKSKPKDVCEIQLGM
ncbi:uncharacterized protein LOC108098037 [Drosophila ficusphila]|uniref:uncharacterized protein LOC108098037 n=1 Tax=Drosophila ficusphila TaxID=30025 RepID=UPI0007E6AB2A|nr:uncharacterized protein LOC108098037 [Drosophila ficusphila]